jgi:acyl-CoA synthetase (AMP-forming)/AMP-acid ligase II/acyl carrier protein
VSFIWDLARFGRRTALVTSTGAVSYRELDQRASDVSGQLSGDRRLVVLRGSNTAPTIAAYLGALRAGHPVLIAPPDKPTAWLDEADIVITGGEIDIRRPAGRHALHPELALLLSTSGSTGAEKLVRLSRTNIEANAESIAQYLEITDDDRAVTTLPMHYCYGLSVIHSYLSRGASLLLTDGSVTDAGFWDTAREQRVTSFAGVPHTFELLERIGFEALDLPDLRYVTQAGGRMAPERVRTVAALGRRQGWRLYVMYGQTEATARMSYLPPELADVHPGSVGIAIPGGSFRIDPLPRSEWPETDGAGELVYSGPNVMLGYAEKPADLALGRTVHELRTGDVAKLNEAGLVEIVGRRGRFLKLFGLRIDLQKVEEMLAGHGYTAGCVGDDHLLQVAVVAADPEEVRRLITQAYGLPGHAVAVHAVAQLPRLDSGKIDYPALRRAVAAPAPTVTVAAVDLLALYAEILDRPDATEDDSFVSLGGDSLSYVEMTVRLEQALGTIPPNWHITPIRSLRASAEPPARTGWRFPVRRIETSVALRALGIILIVGDHVGAFLLDGAAHALLAVVGFNLARFSLATTDRVTRLRRLGSTSARIAAISIPVLAFITWHYPQYTVAGFFDGRHVFGIPEHGHSELEYWFIFAVIYLQLFVLGLIAIPWVHRRSLTHPFIVPMALVFVGLVGRYQFFVHGITLPTPARVFWLVAIGWAIAEARTTRHRLVISAIVGLAIWGALESHAMELRTLVLVLALIWLPWLPSTRLVNRVAGWIAASTLAVYLTHWLVFRQMRGHALVGNKVVMIIACLVAGAIYFRVAEWVIARVATWWRDRVQSRRVRDDDMAPAR